MYVTYNRLGNKIKPYLLRSIIIGLCIVYLIIGFPSYEPLPQMTAVTDAALLNNMGIPAVAYDRFMLVQFPEAVRIFELSSECSGLALFAMYCIGIFIVPAFSLKHRMIALLFLPLLFIGNALRVMAGILVGIHMDVNASMFFHDTFGQIIIFFWVLTCFIAWLKLTKNFPTDRVEVVR